ncbi:DNA replication/repair protein RecF [Candidatus Entotheonella palauensis]|uniref:DNA replication/repair protein RecF n=1 Tax=Candidatus Entotheonella palauensis TaxID=93172 RepID=UPI000B7E76F2|nr:DNA replication and repair protein RecF [Candidatus Entotheonella palauensis]
MYIERLVLRHFRNYKETTLAFAPGGAYISGANGSGKTNILESIYYLANHASFRTTRREELQTWNVSQSAVYALVTQRETGRQSELAIHLTPNGRRLFLNGKEMRDLRRFTSEIAAVAFHPGTMNVIKGGPAGRRYLVDRGIFSLQPEFGQTSQHFQRALKQRNALLRRNKASSHASSLATWTEHFIETSVQLMLDRQAHVERLNRALETLVEALGNDVGLVSLQYQPAIFAKCNSSDEVLAAWEDEKRLRERCLMESERLQQAEEAMGQTLFGPQRDDFTIRFRGRESRGYASQGEQRLAAFLLVAALAIEIRQQRGHHPVILLDDVISELDARNRQVIFDFLKAHAFQVLITDVEARPQVHNLSSLTSLHVKQVGGWADVQGGVDLDSTPHDL